MIARYVIHIEKHRGYRPRLSVRRAWRHGARVTEGGQAGTLVRCGECSGVGYLHKPDAAPKPTVEASR